LKFTREFPTSISIRSVSNDAVCIGAQTYNETVALTPDVVIESWPAGPVHALAEVDFRVLFDTSPELVVLGTGRKNIFPPRELVFAFARRGIGLEVMNTPAAARTFNVLAGEGRRIAAVLYIDQR
jgi:uncharacterized protein